MQLVDLLASRGLVAQATHEDLGARLAQPTTCYVGFDPTADSLHVGSLIPIMGLMWAQRCGHRPIAVIGGATAMIGDPSGKSEARKMLTRDDIRANAAGIGTQLKRFLRFDNSPSSAKLVDNADWLAPLSWIDLLREAGPHFSVNRMLSMDSVKGRLDGGGISFLEFNYMVMQAWDFLHLWRSERCTLQMGGQDQWGNIVMGMELARRKDGAELCGLTFPLITKSDGAKFGKSEAGNIWLSTERTPPYDFYQFWRNTGDADVRRFLGFFTDLPMEEVTALTTAGGSALNAAKERLAFEVTRTVHGAAAADQARNDSKAAFGAAHDVTGDSIPHADLHAADLAAEPTVVALLVRAGLAASNGEAKRLIQGGGVRVHDAEIADLNRTVTTTDVREGALLLRVGKKRLFRFDVR